MANLENAGIRSSERTANTKKRLINDRLWFRLEPWLPTLIVLALLSTWEWLSRTNIISNLFFPPPTLIIKTLVELTLSGKLTPHLVATLTRLLLGLVLGCVPGLLVGLLMGWSPRLQKAVDPIIAALNPLPKIAIFPLIMIIFGIGEISKVVAIAIAAFFPMAINSVTGVRQINPICFEVTKNYGANRWKTLTRVIIPGSLPVVLTGARISINVALVLTIAVELVASENGLGVLTWFAWQTLRIQELYAALVVMGLMGVLINIILQRMSQRIAPWYHPVANGQY